MWIFDFVKKEDIQIEKHGFFDDTIDDMTDGPYLIPGNVLFLWFRISDMNSQILWRIVLR